MVLAVRWCLVVSVGVFCVFDCFGSGFVVWVNLVGVGCSFGVDCCLIVVCSLIVDVLYALMCFFCDLLMV